MTDTLSAGSAPATTSVDAQRVGDGLRCHLVVAGHEHAPQAELPELPDGRSGGRAHGVGHRDRTDRDAVAPHEDGRTPQALPFGALVRRSGGIRSRLHPTDRDAMPFHRALGPEAGVRREREDFGQRPQILHRSGRDGPGDGMLRRLLESTRPPQKEARIGTGGGATSVTFILPSVTVPVLSNTTVSISFDASRAW